MTNKLRKFLLKNKLYMKLEVKLICFILKKTYHKKFKFQDKEYKYFIHKKNSTYSNERMVEIPILRRFLNQCSNKKILEIGNVMHNYTRTKHEVVDLLEKHPKVTYNEDIINFKPKKKYDFVFSISTIEHIGFDEGIKKKEPKKIEKALKKIISFTKEKFIFTIPMGFNPNLDKDILQNKFDKFGIKFYFMIRTKPLIWKEVSFGFIKNYDIKFEKGILAIGVYEK